MHENWELTSSQRKHKVSLNDCLARACTSSPSLIGAHLLPQRAFPHIRVIHHVHSTANYTAAVHKSDRLPGRCMLMGLFKRCTVCPEPIYLLGKGSWIVHRSCSGVDKLAGQTFLSQSVLPLWLTCFNAEQIIHWQKKRVTILGN